MFRGRGEDDVISENDNLKVALNRLLLCVKQVIITYGMSHECNCDDYGRDQPVSLTRCPIMRRTINNERFLTLSTIFR